MYPLVDIASSMISDSLRGVAIQYLSIVGWAMPTKTLTLWALPTLRIFQKLNISFCSATQQKKVKYSKTSSGVPCSGVSLS